MEIYGKNNFRTIVSEMVMSKKLVNSYIITGENGVGKNFCAQYLSQSIMCENIGDDGTPCGECRTCKLIDKEHHPDIFCLRVPDGRTQYTVESVREMILDANVAANEDGNSVKIYVIRNCELLNVDSQNALLKTIEDPIDGRYYILMAESRTAFLDTIVSRALCIDVAPVSDEDCRTVLLKEHRRKKGEDENEVIRSIDEAVSSCHGNIGRCMEYLKQKDVYKQCEKVRRITSAMVRGSEYDALTAFGPKPKQHANAELITILKELDRFMRDVMVIKTTKSTNNLISCSTKDAQSYANKVTYNRIARIHKYILTALECCDKGMNINSDIIRDYVVCGIFG